MVPAFVSVVEETKTICGFVTKRRQAITSEATEKLNFKKSGALKNYAPTCKDIQNPIRDQHLGFIDLQIHSSPKL